ncbi:acyltransferase family protein [Flavobacteriaceae bacterium M23B6Z8]
MKTIQSKTERIYSLDSLRAVMMLLGLVLHSAITYGTVNYESSWALKDTGSVSLLNDLIVIFIHSFRMPIFFLVAGFFGALLFYERSPLKMMKNRVSRIVYPFLVFLLLFSPILIFGNVYTGYVLADNTSPWQSTLAYFSDLTLLLPLKTYHLWFLYYLAIISAVTVLIAFSVRGLPTLSVKIKKVSNWIFKRPFVRVFLFASMTFVIYLMMGIDQVETSMSLIPDFNTFIFYFSFYLVGWTLFKSKNLLGSMKRFDWLSVIIATLLLFTYIFTYNFLSFPVKIAISSLVVWFFAFGITGLFIRYGSKYSGRMRYISDASYWIYLFHLPFTVYLPALISDWPVSAITKFVIVMLGTAIPCFITYHYLVRPTFIGKFLNGRRYPRNLPVKEAFTSEEQIEGFAKAQKESYKEASTV